MNFHRYTFFLLISVFVNCLPIPSVYSQKLETDSSYLHSYAELRRYFPEVHTGSQYARSQPSVDGHPYYGSNTMEYGSLTIQGYTFSGVPLQFDIFDDLLITLTPAAGQRTVMNVSRLHSFTLADGSVFKKKENVDPYYFHQNGFYREVVQGNVSLYCKHYKEIQKDSSPLTPFRTYLEIKRYFIEVNGKLQPVRRRKDLFVMMELDRKTVRKIMRPERLKFKRDKEEYLKKVVNLASLQRI